MNKQEVVEALKYLEAKYGKSPSVAEIAEYCECSSATAWKYLNEAEKDGTIVKSGGKFMTPEVARAYRQRG